MADHAYVIYFIQGSVDINIVIQTSTSLVVDILTFNFTQTVTASARSEVNLTVSRLEGTRTAASPIRWVKAVSRGNQIHYTFLSIKIS